MTRSTLAAVVLVGISTAVHADTRRELVERLYRESGMEVQLAALPAQFSRAVADSAGQWGGREPLPERFAQELGEGMERAFDLVRFRATVTERLREDLDEGQIRETLDWLRSPAGSRMTALEEASATLTLADYEAAGRELAVSPPPTHYVQQVHRLMEATRAVESAVEVALMMQLGIVAAAVGATPDTPPGALGAAVRQLESMRPQIQQAVGNQVSLAFLHTYRDADPADLEAYLAFATSATGEAYHRASVDGMTFAYRDVSLAIGREVAALVQRLLSEKRT